MANPGSQLDPAILLVTGIPGAGKTSVSHALAARFERGVHIEGDQLQRMIVSGAVWPAPPQPTGEAEDQLRLRYRNSAHLAASFFDAGFHVVIDDVVIGEWLSVHQDVLRPRPFRVIVLVPDIESVRLRNSGRDKDVFEIWGYLDSRLRDEMRDVGDWIDSTGQTVTETVDEIIARLTDD